MAVVLVGQRFPRSITKFRVLSSAGEPQNNVMDEGGEVSENSVMDDGGEVNENNVMGEMSKYVACFFTPRQRRWLYQGGMDEGREGSENNVMGGGG